MINTILQYILVILVISIIIIAHELGHFFAARRAGVKVEKFGVGMGPKIFSLKRNETEYCLCAIPIGGFCQLKGEEEASNDPDSFDSKSPFKKFLIAFSGPFANILLSILILILTFNLFGNPFIWQIKTIQPDSPAAKAGFMIGDEFIGINGNITNNWGLIREEISKSPNKEIIINVRRGDKELSIPVVPKQSSDGTGLIGVEVRPSDKRESFINSIKLSLEMNYSFFKDFITFLGMLFTGKVTSVAVAGPVGIVTTAASTVAVGWSYFFFFMALLSVNLGLINLFPFPPLDGGRIIFSLIEGIFKKKVNKNVEATINTIGFMLLMALIVFVTWNDIARLISPH
jgi:regulator of sigma E protease